MPFPESLFDTIFDKPRLLRGIEVVGNLFILSMGLLSVLTGSLFFGLVMSFLAIWNILYSSDESIDLGKRLEVMLGFIILMVASFILVIYESLLESLIVLTPFMQGVVLGGFLVGMISIVFVLVFGRRRRFG